MVLSAPYSYQSRRRHVLSYHLERQEAIQAADAYTSLKRRRAIVGLLRWTYSGIDTLECLQF